MTITRRSYCVQCERYIYEQEDSHFTAFPTHVAVTLESNSTTYSGILNSTVSGLNLLVNPSGSRTTVLTGFTFIENALLSSSGTLVSKINEDIVSYSGFAEVRFLNTAGDTLTGDLVLNTNSPTLNLHAASKGYVDAAISGSAISGAVADALSSLLQVDLTIGSDLLTTNSGLPLNEVTAVIDGGDFTLGTDNIVIKDPGLYQFSWNVVGLQSGTAAIRRRNLVCDLNINNLSFPEGSLGGTYSRSSDTSPFMNVGGDYIITTTGVNTAVAVRTRDLSTETTAGVIYQTAGGYFRVRLVRKS